MKNQVLTLIILLSLSLLSAEDRDSTLNLDDIFIFGKAETIADSIKPVTDNPEYTGFNAVDNFEYTPEKIEYETQKIESDYLENNNLLHLSAGNKSWICGRAVYIYPERFNFSGKYFHQSSEDKTEEVDVSINSHYRGINGYLSFGKYCYSNSVLENKTNRYQIILPGIKLNGTKFIPEDIGIELSLKNYEITPDSLTGFKEKERTDFDVKLNTKWKNSMFITESKLNFISRKLSGNLSISLNPGDETRLNKFGVWIGADEKRVLPSLHYTLFWNTGKGTNLIFMNNPVIGHWSRQEMLEKTHYLAEGFAFAAEKSPLNHDLIIESKLPVDFFWNCRYTYDSQGFIITETDSLDNSHIAYSYTQDLFVNTIGFLIDFNWNDFHFSDETGYLLYSEDEYYKPLFKTISEIKWEKDKIKFDLELEYSTGFKDINNDYLEDKLMLNSGFRYQTGRYITILLAIDNILDKDFRCVSSNYQPGDSGITIRGGINLHF